MPIFLFENLWERINWCLTVVLIASFYIFRFITLGSVVMTLITILILVNQHIFEMKQFVFKFNDFHYTIFLFSLYCFFSALWARIPSMSIEKGVTVLEILLCMSVLYQYYESKNINYVISALMWAGFVVVLYTFAYYGVGTIISVLSSGSRLSTQFVDVNELGLVVAIAVIINVYYITEKIVKWWSVFGFLSIVVVSATGSRTALISMVLGVVLVIIFKNVNRNGFFKAFFLSMFCIIASFFLVYQLSKLEMFWGINERMEGIIALFTGKGNVDHSAYLRHQYILLGIEQFKKTPLLGLGIGNSSLLTIAEGHKTFLHNNFVELLACGGVVGFMLFYSITIIVSVQLIKLREYWTSECAVCFAIILAKLLADYGNVSYYMKVSYFLFMIIYLYKNNVVLKRSKIKIYSSRKIEEIA